MISHSIWLMNNPPPLLQDELSLAKMEKKFCLKTNKIAEFYRNLSVAATIHKHMALSLALRRA